ncbi:MAG: adenylyl-sulfate kinase [Opitutales bacterium]
MSATPSGHVFWFFGLSGAGKSTLAGALAEGWRARKLPVLTLDGDELRQGLCQGLGFSEGERAENLRRAAETAKLGVRSGLIVVAAFITPLESHRRLVTGIIGRECIQLIHLSAPLAICRLRDAKGLYARADAGQVPSMTGLSSPFDPPGEVDLSIDTSLVSVESALRLLHEFTAPRLPRPEP